MRRTLQQYNICYDTDHIEKENTPITRMHSSRMHTAHSLTVSAYLVVSHARPPRSNHTSPQSNHACHPRATMHPPWEQLRMPSRSNHTPPPPPGATMHALPEQPHPPPGSNHTCPPEQPCMPPEQPCTPPPEQPRMPPPPLWTDRHL